VKTDQLVAATPFITGALIQFFGQIVSHYLSRKFNRDFDSAWNDGLSNNYSLPADFDQEHIKGRFLRDYDTIQAIITLASVFPQILVLLPAGSLIFTLGISVAVLAPILMFFVLSEADPVKYPEKTILKFSVINFILLVVYVGLAVYAFVCPPVAASAVEVP